MKKLHYHSDCPFFAGCENMLVNFLQDDELNNNYDISFSYRKSEEYEAGLNKRVTKKINSHGLSLICEYDLMGKISKIFPLPISTTFKVIYALIPFKYLIFLYNFYQCRSHLKMISPDIVHINNGGYPAASSANAMVIAAHSLRVKRIFYVVNNIANTYRSPIRWYDFPIDRVVRKYVTKFITGSENAGRAIREVLSLAENKWQKIYNGISARKLKESTEQVKHRLGVSDEDFLIGLVALFEERKGHEYLIRAIEKVSNPKVKLLLEGDGPLLEAMQILVKKLNLQDRVIFIGDEENVFDFINALDLFVLPSIRNEDFPNVILEAMSLGKPVVATSIAGIPEQIVDGETGIVVAPKSVDALSVAIEKLAGDDALAKSMGEKAKMRFNEHFTVRNSLAHYQKLYRS